MLWINERKDRGLFSASEIFKSQQVFLLTFLFFKVPKNRHFPKVPKKPDFPKVPENRHFQSINNKKICKANFTYDILDFRF
jgi:hypothetical protein